MMDLKGDAETANVLIYGDPGCGKTSLTATLPGRVLWLAGEPGFVSAARRGGTGKVRIIPDTATANAAVQWLEDGGYKSFDWIVADGFSTMGNKFLLGYAAEAFDLNPAKRAHRNLPDKPDYYNTQNFMKGWAARMVDLPVNTLFTAHAHHTEDRDGELRVYPGIQGKSGETSDFISGLFHCVGYMVKRNIPVAGKKGEFKEVRRILWQTTVDGNTDTRYIAKDQYDSLGRYTDDLTMTEFMEKVGLPVPTAPTATPATKATAARRRR